MMDWNVEYSDDAPNISRLMEMKHALALPAGLREIRINGEVAVEVIHDIGWARLQLVHGHKVRRAGWNGKGMFLVYVPGTDCVLTREGSPYKVAGLHTIDIDPHIDIYTAAGTMQPGWVCSQADLLATDWEIAEEIVQ